MFRRETTPIQWASVIQALILTVVASDTVIADTGDAAASPPPSTHSSGYTVDYVSQVQPIFNRRCIACHGCLGSPCNVKLDSFPGVERGGFEQNPYAAHLGLGVRTDMEAANSTAEWRERGFYPIVARQGAGDANLQASLLFRMIDAGRRHNLPGFSREALDAFRQGRFAAVCPSTPEALSSRLSEHPALGMPYGLPAIGEKDFAILEAWIAAGAPGPSAEQLQQARNVSGPKAVAAWEAFFNSPDKRQQLVARYIFEHVFLATITLEESPGDRFRLVRSATAPPELVMGNDGTATREIGPLEVIATDLPYDDPYTYAGVKRFWYRLEKITEPPMQKNLWLWRLRLDDIEHLAELFLSREWAPDADLNPPWGIGNPFRVFAAIPAEARYRFLLENSEVIVGGITYGPVCNGQIATYAVKDQFWVFFLDPAHDASVQNPKLGLDTWDVFMNRSPIGNAEYVKAYAAAQARLTPEGWSLDALWDGGGENPNAWLTILRHETNVSVTQGGRGGIPRTYWLISYSGLERMYYDTVASFKYWGSDGHKLETLLFFNFLRQEFEDNFLKLLPAHRREAVREQWTQGVGSIGLMVVPFAGDKQPTQVQLDDADPILDLVSKIRRHLGPPISGGPDRLNPQAKPVIAKEAPIRDFDAWETAISTLTAVKGYTFVRHLPSVILLRLKKNTRYRVYSLVANRVYKSQYTLLFQNGQALPAEDTVSVYRGVVNGYPNLFVDLDLVDAKHFLADLRAVETESDWTRVALKYGVLRNSQRFWPLYDWFNDWNFSTMGSAAGWLDLSYYDAPEI